MSSIYVQIPAAHNGNGSVIKMDLLPQMTMDEVRSFFYAAAEIPESDKDVILKLTKKDGTLVPITSHISSNDASDPYLLQVKSRKLSFTK